MVLLRDDEDDRSAHGAATRTGLGDGEPNGETASHSQNNRNGQPAEQPSPLELSGEGGKGGGDGGAQPPEEPAQPDHAKRVADWTRYLTIVTGVLVFVGVCQLVAGILQWSAIRQQIVDARSSGADAARQTERIIDLQTDLNAAEGFQGAETAQLAANTGEQAKSAGQLVQVSGDQLATFKASADAAAKSADAQNVESRAFISITDFQARIIDVAPKKMLQLKWKATNSGNTPGIIERVPLAVTTFYWPDKLPAISDEPDRWVNPVRPIHHQVVLGGKDSKWNEVFPREVDNETAQIVSMGGTFQVFGQVFYKDMLGESHVSGFAFQLRQTDKGTEAKEIFDSAFTKYN